MTKSAESKPPSSTPVAVGSEPVPAHVISLIRHFTDLRDGVHGDAVSRHDKEALFAREVGLLSAVAHQALSEINA